MDDTDYGPRQYVNLVTGFFSDFGNGSARAILDGLRALGAGKEEFVRFCLTDYSVKDWNAVMTAEPRVYGAAPVSRTSVRPALYRAPGEWGLVLAFQPRLFQDKTALVLPQLLVPDTALIPDASTALDCWPETMMFEQGLFIFNPAACEHLFTTFVAAPEQVRAKYGSFVQYITKHTPEAASELLELALAAHIEDTRKMAERD
jgi:hypothetical protein